MDYTSSNSYSTDAGTGQRMHLQAQATPTAVSDTDLNGLIWELLALIKAGGIAPAPFDKTVPATYNQVAMAIQSGKLFSSAGAGTANAITGTFAPAIASLKDGMALYVRAAAANTVTNPTFTPSNGTIAAKTIVKGAGSALVAGDIAGAGHWVELQYDLALDKWVLLNPAFGIAASTVPVGTIINFSGAAAPTGFLVCPTAQTNISRTTYAALFAVIGTTWGAGDGSTTFGMPWYPADYADVQASANVGTQSVGAVISHTHRPVYGGTPSTTTTVYNSLTNAGLGAGASAMAASVLTIESTGGAANYAAGVRTLRCVKY